MVKGKQKKVLTAEPAATNPAKSFIKDKRVVVGLLAIILLVLLAVNRGLFLAAIVDGKPIFRWQLNRVLLSRFGQQTLESMVGEKLVEGAAKKSKVTVTDAEVEAKEQEIVKSLGSNVNLNDLLKYQGLTKTDFDNQVKLQLTVAKILSGEIQISDADIDSFIASNAASLSASEPAALRSEARETLLNLKISERLQAWFLELKDKAKILRFL